MTKITLRNERSFAAADGSSILEAGRLAGVVLEHSCRTGRCGVCKASLSAGKTRLLQPETGLSHDELARGMILTCCRAPEGDINLDIEDLGRLSDISVQTLPCRISALALEASNVATVRLRLPPSVRFAYLPGQYVNIIAKGVKRSYSLANAPRPDGELELHIRKVPDGVMSGYWFGEAKQNDLLRLEGPLGTFFLRDTVPDHLIFLMTGTGLAPAKAIMEELAAMMVRPFQTITAYWGNRHAEDFYWKPGELPLDMKFIKVLSRADQDWQGRRGHVQDALGKDGHDLANSVVYACGSDAMIASAEAYLVENGLERRHFYYDAFVSSD